MNNKVAKKLRKMITRDTKDSFNSFADAINQSRFLFRVKIAFKVLMGKL